MKRSRGFRLGRKIVKVFKWIVIRRRKPSRYHRLDHPIRSKLHTLVRSIRRGAKEVKELCCSPRSKSGYKLLGQYQDQDPFKTHSLKQVPKGHLAVYVGESDDDAHRVLVPVIYFNHPLFTELLKEAERVYGYDHQGGITIPCGISEFEKVQTKIAAGEHFRRRTWRRRHW